MVNELTDRQTQRSGGLIWRCLIPSPIRAAKRTAHTVFGENLRRKANPNILCGEKLCLNCCLFPLEVSEINLHLRAHSLKLTKVTKNCTKHTVRATAFFWWVGWQMDTGMRRRTEEEGERDLGRGDITERAAKALLSFSHPARPTNAEHHYRRRLGNRSFVFQMADYHFPIARLVIFTHSAVANERANVPLSRIH